MKQRCAVPHPKITAMRCLLEPGHDGDHQGMHVGHDLAREDGNEFYWKMIRWENDTGT